MISEFDNIRTNGKICISLKEDDELIEVKKTTGENLILLGSSEGRMVKFNESEVRQMGRTASGVRGINLGNGATCVCGEVVKDDDIILLVTKNGYGKKSLVNDFRQTSRGSKGVKALNVTEKNGNLVSVKLMFGEADLIIMTNSGMTMRMSTDQIPELGRVTQGVRLINLKDNQKVATVSLVDKSIENPEENDEETN